MKFSRGRESRVAYKDLSFKIYLNLNLREKLYFYVCFCSGRITARTKMYLVSRKVTNILIQVNNFLDTKHFLQKVSNNLIIQ